MIIEPPLPRRWADWSRRAPSLRRPAFRPRVEGLEDRLVLATLPAGFSEAAVAVGLTGATAMELSPEGRLWVLEQSGTVEVFHGGSATGSPALVIPPGSINSSGERGLLGIAFDPSYDVNSPAPDFVYLYYTLTSGPNPHNRVSRFIVDNSNPDRPTLSGEKVLVNLDPLSAATNHNGGAIHFGPDGKLYVAVGENGQSSNSQSLTTRLGKILRYNADGTIPADNPSTFPGISGSTAGVDRAIWAVGLRNPYTFTFQPGTGRMHINDVGENSMEEIDIGAAGANYGWPITEGDFNQASFPNLTRPFYSYSHGTGTFQGRAITGGAFYNPTSPGPGAFPASYDGDYFFADYVNHWVNVIDTSTKAVARFASDVPGPVDLLVAGDGSLLYLARDAGSVVRVVSDAVQSPAIVQPPQDQATGQGGSATFSVVATGTAPLAYQWQRAAAGTSAFSDIPGATSSSVAVANAQASDDGSLFRVVVSNAAGSLTSGAGRLVVTSRPAPTPPSSFDGSGRTDLAVYLPSIGAFAYRPVVGSDQIIRFGLPGAGQTIPASADYSGSGRTQVAAYIPGFGVYAIRPDSGPDQVVPFGIAGPGQSIPAPADYEGTGRADIAVYLPAFGAFGIRPSTGGPDRIVPFGIAGAGQSLPAPGDYSGTGRADIAVYLPALGAFAIRPSGGGPDQIIPFGLPGPGRSIPIPGDYDGSGRTEIAAYFPEFGLFAYRPANGGPDVLVAFGAAGDGSIPVPGDYSGSGRTEFAVYDPNFATFAYRPTGRPDVIVAFGAAGPGQSIPATATAGGLTGTVAASSLSPGGVAATRRVDAGASTRPTVPTLAARPVARGPVAQAIADLSKSPT